MFNKLQELLNERYGESSFEFSYNDKKIKYTGEECGDPDVSKTCHDVTIDGKRFTLDFSPYSTVTKKDIMLWIDCGMPSRKDLGQNGPIRTQDLEKYAQTKNAS